MHAGLPQIAMNFPEYQRINSQFEIAVLLNDLAVDGIADAINNTMENDALRCTMSENALKAKEVYCWQQEEKILVQFYQQLFA